MNRAINLWMLMTLLLTSECIAQSKKYDPPAQRIIERMSDVIGNMESCRFRLQVVNDVSDPSKGIVKHWSDYEVYLSGPDKMLVIAHGSKGHRRFVYNGRQIAWLSFDELSYGIIPAPSTTIRMIDSLHEHFDFEFPAADFFYPAFTDDLLENADSISFLGITRVRGTEYFHIVADGTTMNLQFWVSNDAFNLPALFSITYKNGRNNPQYLATFSDWEINPHLPVSLFDFSPPPGAAKIRILSKSDR